MTVLFLGDIHGCWKQANTAIRKACFRNPGITHIIQVGDLADGWYSRWKPETDLPITWIDGNHEYWPKINARDFSPRLSYQPRGSVKSIDEQVFLFMGGAHSIDKPLRTPMVDWWPDEDITREQLKTALLHNDKIDVVVSHDRPQNFPWPTFVDYDLRAGMDNRLALQHILEMHKPKYWFHGHHHWGSVIEHDGTTMIACPIIESGGWTIFDGETITKNWK